MMDLSTQTENQPPDWEITGAEQVPGPIGPGGIMYVMRVTFRLHSGVLGSVDVPMGPGWNTKAVQMVAEHARDLLNLIGTKSTDF